MSIGEDLFSEIIESVETGIMTPEEAATDLANLKREHDFKSDWTLADFQNVRESYLSEYLEDELFDEDDDLEFEDDADE